MTTVFIGGSRRITRLNDTIRTRVDNIIRQQFTVLIGDANGIDKAVQSYFASKGYRNVVVYCMADRCRNNVGGWPAKHVVANQGKRNFAYYATKDQEMAKAASCGFMIWDGKSRGTLNNIVNLLRDEKPVLVYSAPDKSCHTLKSQQDLSNLLQKSEAIHGCRLEEQSSPAPREVDEAFQLFSGHRG